jgi:hypothetical protein
MAMLLLVSPLHCGAGGTDSAQPTAQAAATPEQEPAKSQSPPAAGQEPKRLLNPPKAGESWWMREGKGYTLCEALYDRLQSYTPDQLGVCTASVVAEIPGIRALDTWTELDPRKHEALFKKLTQYDKVGVRTYFSGDSFEKKKIDDARLHYLYQQFLQQGGRMRMNTIQVFRHPLADPITTYGTPQTVIELRLKNNKEICPDSPTIVDVVRTFYVTKDLSGPDPSIKAREASSAALGELIEYKGELHLMYGRSGLSFSRQMKDGMMRPFCEIQDRQAG